ncbi:hypothetical protein NQ317_004858 [Molorchus minor]|uniref:Uncharacterized protein n=1 Tax=Molorchus minor TaxID=1323400 RepID=A0ABQ9J988_9CUCU|nr:hypothetical protein NQ317_004858 [Molorchus minor]
MLLQLNNSFRQFPTSETQQFTDGSQQLTSGERFKGAIIAHTDITRFLQREFVVLCLPEATGGSFEKNWSVQFVVKPQNTYIKGNTATTHFPKYWASHHHPSHF